MIALVIGTFTSLLISNIAGVFMVQAENRHRPVLAGLFEGVYGLLWLLAAGFTVTTFAGHDLVHSFIIGAAAFAGNFVGSYFGTKLGDKYLLDPDAKRITALESDFKRHHDSGELGDE